MAEIHPALKKLAEIRRKGEPEKYETAVDDGWKDEIRTLNDAPATGEVHDLPEGMTHENLEDMDHIMLANLMIVIADEDD